MEAASLIVFWIQLVGTGLLFAGCGAFGALLLWGFFAGLARGDQP